MKKLFFKVSFFFLVSIFGAVAFFTRSGPVQAVTGTLNINLESPTSEIKTAGGGNIVHIDRTDIPTAANAYCPIGTITNTGPSRYIRINIYNLGTGSVDYFNYVFEGFASYQTGGTTTWTSLPLRAGVGSGGRYFSVDTQVGTVGGSVELRLRRLGGSNVQGVGMDLQTSGIVTKSAAPCTTGGTYATGFLGGIGYDFPTALGHFEAATSGLFIRETGNVGIGTANPGVALDVASSVAGSWDTALRLKDSASSTTWRLNACDNVGDTNCPANGLAIHRDGVASSIMFTSAGDTQLKGDLLATGDYGKGLVGLYSDVRYQNLFSMGSAYRLAADGTTTGNLYGIAWTHSNIGGQSKAGLAHQALFMLNGATQSAIGTGVWTAGLATLNQGVMVDGQTVIDDGAGWHRTYGATGWYNGTYGGGWVMNQAGMINNYGATSLTVTGGDVGTAAVLADSSATSGCGVGLAALSKSITSWGGGCDTGAFIVGRTVGATITKDTATGVALGLWVGSMNWQLGNQGSNDQWLRIYSTSTNTYTDLAVKSFYAQGAVRYDLAEIAPVRVADNLQIGEIVSTDPEANVQLTRSRKAFDSTAVGIVSNTQTASMTIGGDTAPEQTDRRNDRKPIALAGRIITLVNMEGGAIKRGDAITSSSTPGQGMKAYKAGTIISKSMEEFNGTSTNSSGVQFIISKLKEQLENKHIDETEKFSVDKALADLEKPLPQGQGRIVTYINASWYDPDLKLTDTGDIKLSKNTRTNKYEVTNSKKIVTKIGAYAHIILGKLEAGLIETKELVVNGVNIDKKIKEITNQIDKHDKEIQELKTIIKALK